MFPAEIGDFSAMRCGLTYVSDFELIPVLVSRIRPIADLFLIQCNLSIIMALGTYQVS